MHIYTPKLELGSEGEEFCVSAHPEREAVEGFHSHFPIADASGKPLPLYLFCRFVFCRFSIA
jgi:hypothetical protein